MPAFRQFPTDQSRISAVPGEPLRFHIKSATRRRSVHLVDLEECGCNGACGCEHFQFRLLPMLKQDRSIGRRRFLRCQHIDDCLTFLADTVVRKIVNGRPRRTRNGS